jgi:hypothetical protein
MKWNTLLASLVLCMGLTAPSFGFDLLDRMLGYDSGCCGSTANCCEPTCGAPAPSCCTPEPCCAAPKCDKGCGLFGGHNNKGCCSPAPSCCAPEPACCAPEPACCAPAPTCCKSSCCKPKCCWKLDLSHLFQRKQTCCPKKSCCGGNDGCCGAADNGCCDNGCGNDGCCGNGCGGYAPAPMQSAPAAGPTPANADEEMPPMPMMDPAASAKRVHVAPASFVR